MKIEKELISMHPHSIENIEEYLDHVTDIQLKLSECGKDFPKKDGQLIELVMMNLRIPYDVFCSSFHTSGIDCPYEFWKKLKSLFNKVNEI